MRRDITERYAVRRALRQRCLQPGPLVPPEQCGQYATSVAGSDDDTDCFCLTGYKQVCSTFATVTMCVCQECDEGDGSSGECDGAESKMSVQVCRIKLMPLTLRLVKRRKVYS